MKSRIRHEIIESLGYPRYLIQSQRDLAECPHCGTYVQTDPKCRSCPDGFECQWLHSHDEFVALEKKSDHELIQALEFAIQYVAGFLLDMRHCRASCHCDSCNWMGNAERLFNRARGSTPTPGDGFAPTAPGTVIRNRG